MTHPLDLLISYDTVLDIWQAMTPEQQVVALLRLEGLKNEEIAALLELTRQAVAARLRTAKRRIIAAHPELAALIDDRTNKRNWTWNRDPSITARPLQCGWICSKYEVSDGPVTGEMPARITAP